MCVCVCEGGGDYHKLKDLLPPPFHTCNKAGDAHSQPGKKSVDISHFSGVTVALVIHQVNGKLPELWSGGLDRLLDYNSCL